MQGATCGSTFYFLPTAKQVVSGNRERGELGFAGDRLRTLPSHNTPQSHDEKRHLLTTSKQMSCAMWLPRNLTPPASLIRQCRQSGVLYTISLTSGSNFCK